MGAGNWAKNEAKEAKEAGKELWHYARTNDHKKGMKKIFQWKYWHYWLITIIICVLVALLAIYRDKIVSKFEPHKAAIVDTPASWLVPIGILILISFPPLTGHEVVILVVGLIWGLWIGFAIACAGTFLGELACFFAFKYWFTEKARKIEEKSIFYACLARLMRDGGLPIIIVVRFSAIPGHVVTAIQSTVGMSVWIYCIAVIVSLPKQLAIVYLGVEFGVSKAAGSSDAEIKKQRAVSLSVFFATCLATVLAAYIVYMRARRVYPELLREAEERNGLTHVQDAEEGMLGARLTRDSQEPGAPNPFNDSHAPYPPNPYPHDPSYGPPHDGYPMVDPFEPPQAGYRMDERAKQEPLREQGIEQGSMSQVDLLPYPGESREEYKPIRYESM